ncbi:MAG: DUF1674 domain-containing protein [Hyphomicrobiales bacterium]|nr:DUF1674 domain-containing protein [Hyphomicrobiales bacterium]
MTNDKRPEGTTENAAEAPVKKLSPAARRALAEAETRRAGYMAKEAEGPAEHGGRGGKDPARYGDWEVKGKAVDF